MNDLNNPELIDPVEDPNGPFDALEPKVIYPDGVKGTLADSIQHYVQPEVTESVVERIQSELPKPTGEVFDPSGDNLTLTEAHSDRKISRMERWLGPENFRIMKGLSKTWASRIGFALIVLFALIAIFAPLIAPPVGSDPYMMPRDGFAVSLKVREVHGPKMSLKFHSGIKPSQETISGCTCLGQPKANTTSSMVSSGALARLSGLVLLLKWLPY